MSSLPRLGASPLTHPDETNVSVWGLYAFVSRRDIASSSRDR